MRKRLLPAAAAAIVAAGLVSAGAAAPEAPSADLSSVVSTNVTPAVEAFVETGVLPTDVRGEPGVWNYAGPAGSCPGPGWNCVTLNALSLPITQAGTVNVLQCVGAACAGSTQTGYTNTYECEPAEDAVVDANGAALQECVIEQGGEQNEARCIQKKRTTPFMRQRCSIDQTGEENHAVILQVIEQTGGPVQGALQEAGISQDGVSANRLQLKQEIKQFTTEVTAENPATPQIEGGFQDQDAYQVVSGPFGEVGTDEEDPTGPAEQDAEGDGSNQSQIEQRQSQRAEGGTSLRQNDGTTIPQGTTTELFTEPTDCNTEDFGLSPTNPNACVNLEQDTDTGDNQSQLAQAIDNDGATSGIATQHQGSAQGGIDAHVDQASGGEEVGLLQLTDDSGFSKNQADQSETQTLVAAANSTQTQFGPMDCCGIGTVTGPGSWQIGQKSHQHASEGGANQFLEIFGTAHAPDGKCQIGHDAKNNADQTSESFSFEQCSFVVVATFCESGPETPPIDSFVIAQVGECTTTGSFD
jgi:hypothetical protein